MRFVGLALIILSAPLFYAWLKQNPHHQRYFWFALGFLPFVTGAWNLDAAIISWAMWPGHTKGIIVSIIDTAALAVLLTLPRRRVATPFKYLIIAYILAAFLSVAFSNNPQSSFFYVWQLGRMLLLFLAIASITTQPRGVQTIIVGLICGVALQAGFASYQKAAGAIQASGTLGHQNLLGMVTHFALYPALALLLAGGKYRLPLIGLVAGLIVVSFGASRATIGLAGIGLVMLIALSMIRKASGRKTRIAAAGMLVLALATPVALASLEYRYQAKPIAGSSEEREAFERAAMLIWKDHPMGVGANEYVVVSNAGGYAERAGVIWNFGSRSANVHNAYLLVAAETGFIGLATFVLFLYFPIFAALRYAWQDRSDPRGDLALGLAVTLIVVAAHCFYEWVLVTWVVQYMLGICMGMIAGLIMQRKLEQRQKTIETKKANDENDPGVLAVPA